MIHYRLLPDQHTWKLTAEGNRLVFADEPEKARALACAVQIVSANFGRLEVYRDDGTIEEERVYPPRAHPRINGTDRGPSADGTADAQALS